MKSPINSAERRSRSRDVCLHALALLDLTNQTWSADPTLTRQKTEKFDRDSEWDGKNNRSASPLPLIEQDFGYSRSHHAGKATDEIGGRMSPSIRPAWYAKAMPTRVT